MTREKPRKPASGGLMLLLTIAVLILSVFFIIGGASNGFVGMLLLGIFGLLVFGLMCVGFFVVQPNQAAVLTFFGKYTGSVKENGFWWVNPFTLRKKISLGGQPDRDRRRRRVGSEQHGAGRVRRRRLRGVRRHAE
jgi:regulator of protease activity HflC (stomatin/prohibitin superfamily)